MSKLGHILHGLFHALAILASVSTVATDVVPAKYKPLVVAVIGLAQAVVSFVNIVKRYVSPQNSSNASGPHA